MSTLYSIALAIRKSDSQKINRQFIKEKNYELSIEQTKQIIEFFKDGAKCAPLCFNNDYVYFYWKSTKWWKLQIEVTYFYKLLREEFNNHYDLIRINDSGEIVEKRINIGLLDTEMKIKFNKGGLKCVF